ncbi:adhesion G-protein coupled receptor G2-like [Triplophysa dalaica]|uniref:adhesion G-protein coupled receptor G2-like n=1 Tax=Triplophysa dalaica TaxID=1582913 RepID=UPI0024DFF27E|nr:adhesion G-protein coupled receptor G2-like [Triplophysa dalaica]
MESRMLFHRVAYMTLLLVVIPNIEGQDCKAHGNLTRYDNTIKLTISAGLNITVTDTIKNLSCEFRNYSCYIECSFHNFFEKENSTTSKEIFVSVKKNDQNNTVDFVIGDAEDGNSSCTVIKCSQNEIDNLLKRKEEGMKKPHDLFNIPNIKKSCLIKFEGSNYKNYNRVEKKAINSVIQMSNQSQIYTGEDLALSVDKMDLNMTNHSVAPLLFDHYTQVETWIPEEVFKDVSEEQHKVGIVTYGSDNQFTRLRNEDVLSKVIRIEVPDRDIVNLGKRLVIRFPIKESNVSDNFSIDCKFFDEKVTNTWKTTGCVTKLINSSLVECSCDHMTPFAVLLTELIIDPYHWKILSILTYIGCSLSAFFCGCSILSYIVDRNGRKEVSRSIHVSLSAALFLLNITFMLSEWAATLNLNGLCVFVAVVIHYSLLCCFTWMAIEALHLYILLIRVFNIYIKHYMAKLSLIGWGVPAVVVGCLLIPFATKPFYGIKETKLSESESSQICWITEDYITYGVNISYFTLLFLFNIGTLITVSKKIFLLQKKVDNRHSKMPACKDVGTVLGLMCLLGTAWGLVFFTSGYTNLPILYLFCILNSLQGFYIFVWMCVTGKKNRKESLYDNRSTTEISKWDSGPQISLK